MTNPTYFDTFLRAVENADDRCGVLGGEELVFPPDPAYGYWATPRNALTFAAMGVDGVHYAVLRIDGAVTDESPVIHVSPMDFSDPYAVLGASFLEYLAAACGVSDQELEAVFEQERAGAASSSPFCGRVSSTRDCATTSGAAGSTGIRRSSRSRRRRAGARSEAG